MMIKKALLIIFAVCLWSVGALKAEKHYSSDDYDFKLVEVTKGLEFPWGLDFLPDGSMLVTEKRKARLRLVKKDGTLDPRPIKGLPSHIHKKGQGGLLDVVVHPNFMNNRWIYLSYAGSNDQGVGTEVIRARYEDHRLKDIRVIFTLNPKTQGSLHYGSRLVFAADGTIFITTGDRYYYRDEAQNPANHLGSVIRLHDDGSIPKNNPFVGVIGHRSEIYSYGHRNAQGLALRKNNTMWMHEHGPRGGDEVNILDKAGANYGWPAITYGIDYSGSIISEKTHEEGMEQPVIEWTPSIAPSGMAFYSGQYFPKWQDNIFVGALAGAHIRRLVLKGDLVVKQEILLKDYSRIRDVVDGPDGYLYFITDAMNGKIVRIEPLK